MNKKQLKSQRKLLMGVFLSNYCAIENPDIVHRLEKMPHREIRRTIKEVYDIALEAMSFQAVDLTDLYTGRVLLVKDCHNEITPYLNPSLSLIKEIMAEPINVNSVGALPAFTFEDYVDELENHLNDPNYSKTKIKTLGSYQTIKIRGGN